MIYKKIIVAIENDDTDAKLCERATELVADSSARVLLIHVLDNTPPVMAPGTGELHAVQASLVRYDHDEYKESVRTTLQNLSAQVGSAVEDARLIESSDIRSTIHQVASEEGADLIVVGSRGRSGLALMVAGAVASSMLRDAPCDVLAVNIAD